MGERPKMTEEEIRTSMDRYLCNSGLLVNPQSETLRARKAQLDSEEPPQDPTQQDSLDTR